MHVAALSVDLHLPQSHSLKEKRAVIRPILDGCRHRFRVAAAEVAYQDRWQRAGLGFGVVASTPGSRRRRCWTRWSASSGRSRRSRCVGAERSLAGGEACLVAGAIPASARVNEVLREVLAEAIERIADTDDRLALLTVTARRGRSRPPPCQGAVRLALRAGRARPCRTPGPGCRPGLATQVRLKWTPQLTLRAPIPPSHSGRRVEEILRQLRTWEGADRRGGARPRRRRCPTQPGGGAPWSGRHAGDLRGRHRRRRPGGHRQAGRMHQP